MSIDNEISAIQVDIGQDVWDIYVSRKSDEEIEVKIIAVIKAPTGTLVLYNDCSAAQQGKAIKKFMEYHRNM